MAQKLSVGAFAASLLFACASPSAHAQLADTRVVATVTEHHKGDKVVIFKMTAKKRYRRKTGHRQLHTEVQITKIDLG